MRFEVEQSVGEAELYAGLERHFRRVAESFEALFSSITVRN